MDSTSQTGKAQLYDFGINASHPMANDTVTLDPGADTTPLDGTITTAPDSMTYAIDEGAPGDLTLAGTNWSLVGGLSDADCPTPDIDYDLTITAFQGTKKEAFTYTFHLGFRVFVDDPVADDTVTFDPGDASTPLDGTCEIEPDSMTCTINDGAPQDLTVAGTDWNKEGGLTEDDLPEAGDYTVTINAVSGTGATAQTSVSFHLGINLAIDAPPPSDVASVSFDPETDSITFEGTCTPTPDSITYTLNGVADRALTISGNVWSLEDGLTEDDCPTTDTDYALSVTAISGSDTMTTNLTFHLAGE